MSAGQAPEREISKDSLSTTFAHPSIAENQPLYQIEKPKAFGARWPGHLHSSRQRSVAIIEWNSELRKEPSSPEVVHLCAGIA